MQTVLTSLFVVLAMTAGTAQATELLINQQSADEQLLSATRYQINPELGRAWLELDYVRPNRNGDAHGPYVASIPYSVRALISGMSYDVPDSRILFTGAKGSVVCATVAEKRGMFGTKLMITPTGHCNTSGLRGMRSVDDGAYIRHESVFNTYFRAND